MKILHAGSELTPLARTGGLGDVLEALPGALAKRGHEVSVVVPCYRGLAQWPEGRIKPTGVRFHVPVGDRRREAEILEGTLPNGLQVFLVRCDGLFDRRGLYGEDNMAYPDNAERFIFFSKAIVEIARRIMPPLDVIHVHDWQTALVPVLLRERRLPFKSVLTIHNLAFQGSFWSADFPLTNLPWSSFSARGLEFFGNLNLLKGGILYADAITTVSSKYAREVQTPEFGCGLDAVLREHAGKFQGILNGVNERTWNPATDSLITENYKPSNLNGKKACRTALLQELKLQPDPRGPVFAMVGRLAEQKGLDILMPVIDRMLSGDTRLIILGQGESEYERELLVASRRHPGRFAFFRRDDDGLAHRIIAGSDIFLLPSHFEPSALTAMYALLYGTVPVARVTGGVQEIMLDCDPSTDTGNSLLFFEYTPEALWDAIIRAKACFRDPAHWHRIMQRAMNGDFSWNRAATRYEALYRKVSIS